MLDTTDSVRIVSTKSQILEIGQALAEIRQVINDLKAVLQHRGVSTLQRVDQLTGKLLWLERQKSISIAQFAELKKDVEVMIGDALRVKFDIEEGALTKPKFLTAIFLALGAAAKCVDIKQWENANHELKESVDLFGRFYDLMNLGGLLSEMASEKDIDIGRHTALSHMLEMEETLYELIGLFANEFINAKVERDSAHTKGLFKAFVHWHLDVYYLNVLQEISSQHGTRLNPVNFHDEYNAVCRTLILMDKVLSYKLSPGISELIEKGSKSNKPAFYLACMSFNKEHKSPPNAAEQHLKLGFESMDGYSYSTLSEVRGVFHAINEEAQWLMRWFTVSMDGNSQISYMRKLKILESNYNDVCTKQYISSRKFTEPGFAALSLLIDKAPKKQKSADRCLFEPRQVSEIKAIYNSPIGILQDVQARLRELLKYVDENEVSRGVPMLSMEFNIMVFYAVAKKLLDKDIGSGAKKLNEAVRSEINYILLHIDESEELLVFNYQELSNRILVITSEILFALGANVKSRYGSVERPYNVSITKRGPLQNVSWPVPSFAILTGKSGVGKTHLIKYLEENYECQLVIDAKHLETIDRAFEQTRLSSSYSTHNRISMDEICYSISKFGAFPQTVVGKMNTFPIIELLHAEGVQETSAKSNNLHIARYRIKEKLNGLLKKYKLGFLIGEAGYEKINFIKGSKTDLQFTDLSSGEKTLFAVVSCVVCNELLQEEVGLSQPQLMLFDEVDIHFHPEYTKAFFEIIKDNFSKDIYIVMTTHNPTTIALATDTISSIEIWNMDNSTNSEKTIMEPMRNKRMAISMLSNSLLNVAEDKNLVFVEDEDDVLFYNAIYEKLTLSNPHKTRGGNTKLNFIPAGVRLDGDDKAKELAIELAKYNNALPKELHNNIMQKLKEYSETKAHSGGKSQVQLKVYRCDSGSVFGVIDYDHGNEATSRVTTLPGVYAIENYLCCPINIFVFLRTQAKKFSSLYEGILKEVQSEHIGFNGNLNSASKEMLQTIVNIISKRILVSASNELKNTSLRKVKLACGHELQYPGWIYKCNVSDDNTLAKNTSKNTRGKDLWHIVANWLLSNKNTSKSIIIGNESTHKEIWHDLLKSFRANFEGGWVQEELFDLVIKLKQSYDPAPGVMPQKEEKRAEAKKHIEQPCGKKAKEEKTLTDKKKGEIFEKIVSDILKKGNEDALSKVLKHNEPSCAEPPSAIQLKLPEVATDDFNIFCKTILKSKVPIHTFSVTLEQAGREQLREYLFVSVLNKTGILTRISACNDKQPLIVNFIKLSKPQEQIISNFCNSSFSKEVSIELEQDQKCQFKIQFSPDVVQSIKAYINKYKNALDVEISLSQLH